MNADRTKLVERARFLYAVRYSAEISEPKGCLFWAAAFNAAAKEAGLETLLQAGSAQFQFRSDDGKRDTHFSYMFEPAPARERFHAGELPEMHVWSWIKTTNEIVDLSIAYQPQQARELAGYEWSAEFTPPPYLWLSLDELNCQHGRFIYRADMMATIFAVCYLHDFRAKNAHNREEPTRKNGQEKHESKCS